MMQLRLRPWTALASPPNVLRWQSPRIISQLSTRIRQIAPSINEKPFKTGTRLRSGDDPKPWREVRSQPKGPHQPFRARKISPAASRTDKDSSYDDKIDWGNGLDQFLPPHLRCVNASAPSGQRVKDLGAVPRLLNKARDAANVDLLSQPGIRDGRWDATLWLVEQMLAECRDFHTQEELHAGIYKPNLLDNTTLKELTEGGAIKGPLPHIVDQSFDSLLSWHNDGISISTIGRSFLGLIWRSLASMILQAENLDAKDPRKQKTISVVLEILAQMHHINAVPPSLYNYKLEPETSDALRPPTLQLLSTRIMTVLSDIAWKNHWTAEMAKAKGYGYSLPPTRIEPQLPLVGTEIWLELVLWACIEGGWILEAASILHEMEARAKSSGKSWSVISWKEMCEVKQPELSWTDILKLQLDKSRLNQSTGIGIANSGISNIDMGRRTISREVVLAVLDCALIVPDRNYPSSKQSVLYHYAMVRYCWDLLKRSSFNVNISDISTAILRLEEMIGPHDLNLISDILPSTDAKSDIPGTEDDERSFAGDQSADNIAAILGSLHNLLFDMASTENYQGCLKTMGSMQQLLESERRVSPQETADELKNRLETSKDKADGPMLKSLTASDLYPSLPTYTMTKLLNFVNDNGLIDFGRVLLRNDEIDGDSGIMESRDPNLQLALLRFAILTKDGNLVSDLLQHLEPPLSIALLHTVLQCQVVLGQWDSVRSILSHMASRKHTGGWDFHDAFAIAVSILEHGSQPAKNHEARHILEDILSGVYDLARSASSRQPISYRSKAPQLREILATVANETLNEIMTELPKTLRFERVEIPSDAFHDLLRAVVQVNGREAGRILYDKWCSDDPTTSPLSSTQSIYKVVRPRLCMLRTIIKPCMQHISHSTEQSAAAHKIIAQMAEGTRAPMATKVSVLQPGDLSIIKWANVKFQRYGLDPQSIMDEFEGPMMASFCKQSSKAN